MFPSNLRHNNFFHLLKQNMCGIEHFLKQKNPRDDSLKFGCHIQSVFSAGQFVSFPQKVLLLSSILIGILLFPDLWLSEFFLGIYKCCFDLSLSPKHWSVSSTIKIKLSFTYTKFPYCCSLYSVALGSHQSLLPWAKHFHQLYVLLVCLYAFVLCYSTESGRKSHQESI